MSDKQLFANQLVIDDPLFPKARAVRASKQPPAAAPVAAQGKAPQGKQAQGKGATSTTTHAASVTATPAGGKSSQGGKGKKR